MSNLSPFLEPLEPRVAPAALTATITVHGQDGSHLVNMELPILTPTDAGSGAHISFEPHAEILPSLNDPNLVFFILPKPIPDAPLIEFQIALPATIVGAPPDIRLDFNRDFGVPSLDDATSGGFHRVKDFNAQFVKFANRIVGLMKAGQPLPFSARISDTVSSRDFEVSNLRILNWP